MDMSMTWDGFGDDDMEYNVGKNCFKVLSEWERRRRIAAVQVICYVVRAIHLLGVASQLGPIERGPNLNSENIERAKFRSDLMHQLSTHEYAKDVIRMRIHAFLKLCEILQCTSRLHDNRNSFVEEQVAKFLWMLGHHAKNKTIRFFFLLIIEDHKSSFL